MKAEGFTLLPAPEGRCPSCACEHDPAWPHNNQSLFYQYRFYSQRGRWPTWKDAIAHCSLELQEAWERELKEAGHWSEPESDVPDVLPTPHHTIGTITTIPIKQRATRKRRAVGRGKKREGKRDEEAT